MKTIVHYISFAALVLIFGYAGLWKIFKEKGMMTGMQSMGFGETATLLIGWAELLGVAALIFPMARPIAAIWLWPFAIGALTTHWSYHHPFSEYMNALIVTIAPMLLLATDKHFSMSIT